jgi:hypothetical protein
MDRRGPSLSQLAAWADRNDEKLREHRAEAELAAGMERSSGAERPSRFAGLAALAARLRGRRGS